MSRNLSEKQLNMLRSLKDVSDQLGRMPSIRELASAVGLSKATVFQHLVVLRRKGHIVSDGTGHGIRIVSDLVKSKPLAYVLLRPDGSPFAYALPRIGGAGFWVYPFGGEGKTPEEALEPWKNMGTIHTLGIIPGTRKD